MKSIAKLFITTCILLTSSGCALPRISECYQVNKTKMYSEPLCESMTVYKPVYKEIAPLYFGEKIRVCLLFVPGIPYIVFDMREWGNPDEIGKVLAADLQESGICRYASYRSITDELSGASYGRSADYYVEVTYDVIHRARMTTYGLSIIGAVLHYYGAPVSWGVIEVVMDVNIYDSMMKKVDGRKLSTSVPITRNHYTYDERVVRCVAKACEQMSSELRNFVAETIKSRLLSVGHPAISPNTLAHPNQPASPYYGESHTTPEGRGKSNDSTEDRLQKLMSLRDKGLISSDDYEIKKTEILSNF